MSNLEVDPIKVSVIVATYNSGDGLAHVIDSLDAQSLPSAEFEAIFIDDGSTDDTFARLQSLAADRPNLVVDRIPNSGWPGRPRNLATARARGEYVFYMDHDDELFPEALERMWNYAAANRSDVVIAKEVRTSSSLGWENFRKNIPRVDPMTPSVMHVLTPHKLYRRQFLLDHHIVFPEGRTRLEDHVFNVQVYTQADVISVLADYPCYRWIIHESNNSSAEADPTVYWGAVATSLDLLDEHTKSGPVRDVMAMRWYSGRVLSVLGPGWSKRSAQSRATLYPYLHTLLVERFDPRLDARLSKVEQARAALLRADDEPALFELAALDASVKAEPTVESVRWDDGVLVVRASAELTRRDGGRLPLRRDGDRIVRVLPDHLAALVPAAALDVTDDIAAGRCEVGVLGRTSRVEWHVPSTGRVEVVDTPGGIVVRGVVEARLDPRTGAFGAPLTAEIWNLSIRLSAMGYTRQARIPGDGVVAAAALLDDTPAIMYVTKDAKISLDVGQELRSVAGTGRPKPADVAVVRSGDGFDLIARLPRVHARGSAGLAGQLLLDGAEVAEARLVSADGAAWITSSFAASSGSHPMSVSFLGRVADLGLTLSVDGGGVATVSTTPKKAVPPTAAAGPPPVPLPPAGSSEPAARGLGKFVRRLVKKH